MDAKMEDLKKSMEGDKEKDIVFSKSIKAGKRIYYVDVKRNRKDELFIAVTESKKVVSGDADSPAVTYEKHKIFLYQEDFDWKKLSVLSVQHNRAWGKAPRPPRRNPKKAKARKTSTSTSTCT